MLGEQFLGWQQNTATCAMRHLINFPQHRQIPFLMTRKRIANS
jgi:hypothetical protein